MLEEESIGLFCVTVCVSGQTTIIIFLALAFQNSKSHINYKESIFSGQQVLGGSDERSNIIASVIRAAQMQGARLVSADDEAHSSSHSVQSSSETGYRLGDSVCPSEPVRFPAREDDDDEEGQLVKTNFCDCILSVMY